MKRMLAVAALSSLMSLPAHAQTVSFEDSLAKIAPIAAPTLDELLDTLRNSTDNKERLETLETISFRAPSLDSADQTRLVDALQDYSKSSFNPSEIRGKALDTLGKSAAWFKDSSAVKRAVLALTDAAAEKEPSDLAKYKVYALMGLTKVVDHLPWGDQSLQETVVTTALDGHEAMGASYQEKLLSLMVLQKYLSANGSGVFYYKTELLRRAENELVSPIQSNVDAWVFQPEHNEDYRYVMYLCLHPLAHTAVTQPDPIRSRIREVFTRLSEIEPNGRLREMARLYAQRIPG